MAILLATIALAWSYGLATLWLGLLVALASGGLWLAGQRLGWGVSSPSLVAMVSLAACGVAFGLPQTLMLCCIVASLAAWDLDRFEGQLQRAPQIAGEHELRRTHLRRLLVVAGAGLGLGLLALWLPVRIGFGVALLLALLALAGISQAIGFLRREGD